MCYRIKLDKTIEEIAKYYDCQIPVENTSFPIVPDIYPGHNLIAIRETKDRTGRELVPVRWGLIPGWAKDESFGSKTFLARSESAAEKPTFRRAFRQLRCIIPVTAFFEGDVDQPRPTSDIRCAIIIFARVRSGELR